MSVDSTPSVTRASVGGGASGSECFCGGKGWVLVGTGGPNRKMPCPDCSRDVVGICDSCGEAMRNNVPRLGPSGGFVHARTGSLLCACKQCGSAKRSALGTHCGDCLAPIPNAELPEPEGAK